MTNDNSGCGKVIVILGVVASIIAIFTFITGIVSIRDFMGIPEKPVDNPPPTNTDAPPMNEETNTVPPPTETDEPPQPPTERNEPPPGEGGIIRDNGLSIQLVDYKIYSQTDPENEVAYYQLAFINETGTTIEVKFNHSDISAVDNMGINYGDYYDVLKKWYDTSGSYGCICVTCGTPEYPIAQEFSVPASSTHTVDLFLLTADTVGNCGTWDAQMSRVTFDTNYIDLRLATVQYRTDQLYEISDLRWRLNR